MSTKPWEQQWEAGLVAEPQWAVFAVGGEYVVNTLAGDDEAKAKFIRAAPDMARALKSVVDGTLKSLTPVFGPMSIDEVVERGQPVAITAEELGSMVSALRKAGVL